MSTIDLAEVRIWDRRVGAVHWDRARELGSFEYDPVFCENGWDVSPLFMPRKKEVIYTFPGLPRDTYRGLPAMLSDSLPDDFGNAVINAWLAQQGRVSQDFSPVERLLYTGTRGMGALEFHPATSIEHPASTRLELPELLRLAQKVLDHRNGLRETLDPNSKTQAEPLTRLIQVGTSAGGARPKAVVAMNKDRTEIRSGQVDHDEDFEHWLIKFDGVVDRNSRSELFGDPQGFGRMEYAYYLMAKAAGIEMAECDLLIDGDRAHFITKRFDRVNGRREHMQSLCAIAHADYKKPGAYSYEEALGVMRSLRLSREDAIQFFRRMVFNVVARNQDDHTKNIAFLMGEDGRWHLSPAFDVAWAYKPDSPWVSAHQMTINGKRDGFNRGDLLTVASMINGFAQKNINEVIGDVAEAVSQWKTIAKEAGVSSRLTSEISKTLRKSICENDFFNDS